MAATALGLIEPFREGANSGNHPILGQEKMECFIQAVKCSDVNIVIVDRELDFVALTWELLSSFDILAD